MKPLLLATEVVDVTYVGDDLMIVAVVLVGIALLIAAIATLIVTPRADPSDHH